jgi:(R,R)-butanediol dehydrogenase/meso-butanediol dehydrogenase/diacetyl reductase
VSVRWGFAEYVSVNERWAHKIPESISYEEGALMEPLAVAVHNVERSGVEGGEVAVVFGAGPVGNLISQVLKTMGASRVIAVDLVDWRLDLARKLGADVTINPRSKDVVEEVLKITDQTGADVSFEAVGDVGGLGTSDEGNAQRRNHGRDRRIRGTRCQIPHNGLGF